MDHPAPTFCIHVPILDAMDAIHSQRNQVYRSGVHALCAEDFAGANSYSKQTVGPAIVFCGLTQTTKDDCLGRLFLEGSHARNNIVSVSTGTSFDRLHLSLTRF